MAFDVGQSLPSRYSSKICPPSRIGGIKNFQNSWRIQGSFPPLLLNSQKSPASRIRGMPHRLRSNQYALVDSRRPAAKIRGRPYRLPSNHAALASRLRRSLDRGPSYAVELTVNPMPLWKCICCSSKNVRDCLVFNIIYP